MCWFESSVSKAKRRRDGSYGPRPGPCQTKSLHTHWYRARPVSRCKRALRLKSLDEMGKAQKKTGKGRLDKYYKLAKYV
jgi:hypothetical protein